jgi:hypothetical protein
MGLMHRHATHNSATTPSRTSSITMLNFLRDDVLRNWRIYCAEATDDFRVIDPKKYRIVV